MGKKRSDATRDAIKEIVDRGNKLSVPEENVITLNSWAEIQDGFNSAKKLPLHGETVGKVRAAGLKKHSEWSGVSGMRELNKLVAEGMPDAGKRAVEKAEGTASKVSREYIGNRVTYGMTGHTLDVSAFMQGDPECVLGEQMLPVREKVVSLVVDMCASSAVSGEDLRKHGERVLEIALSLDVVGYQSEIWLGWRSGSGDGYVLKLRLKAAGDYLDPAVITFALSSPAMFRGVGFILAHLIPSEKWADLGIGRGYGWVSDLQARDFPEGSVMIPRVENSYGDLVNATLSTILDNDQN